MKQVLNLANQTKLTKNVLRLSSYQNNKCYFSQQSINIILLV